MSINDAKRFANLVHAGVEDKVGVPYIRHCESVASACAADPRCDGSSVRVAWLHDTIEDTDAYLTGSHWTGQLWLAHPNVIEKWWVQLTSAEYWALVAITRGYWHEDEYEESYEAYFRRVLGNRIASNVKYHDLEHNLSPERSEKLPKKLRDRLNKRYTAAKAKIEEVWDYDERENG